MDRNHPTNIHKKVPRKYFADYTLADKAIDPNRRIELWQKLLKDLRKDLVLSDDSKDKIKGLIDVAQSEIKHTKSVMENSIQPPYPEFDGIIFGHLTELQRIDFAERITNGYEAGKMNALIEAFGQWLRVRKEERLNVLTERETLNESDGIETDSLPPQAEVKEEFSQAYEFLEWLEAKEPESGDNAESEKRRLPDPQKVSKQFVESPNNKRKKYSAKDILPVMKKTREYIKDKGIRSTYGHVNTIYKELKELKGSKNAQKRWIKYYAEKAGIETQ